MIIVGCVGMMLSQDPPDPPDAVSKVGTSVQLNIWGYTFNQLSGSGIVGAINGSIGAFSYGNPALLSLHDKITIEFSAYDESTENIYPNIKAKIKSTDMPMIGLSCILLNICRITIGLLFRFLISKNLHIRSIFYLFA